MLLGLAGLLGLVGCPWGPPIFPPPDAPVSAPFILPEDITPDNAWPVRVDLTQAGEESFGVRNLYDPTGGTLRYRWSFSLPTDEFSVELGSGTLQPRLDQPFADLTVYDVPDERLQRCAFPLQPQFRSLLVRLEIIKEVPPEAIAIPGQESFVTTVSWALTLQGECLDP